MAMTLLDHLNLVFSDKKLTPEADRLFSEVFSAFTNEEGFMTRKTCTEFLKFCTNQNTDENDPRVKRLFDNYDKDNKNLITCEEFKDFYADSINKKESTVWANIRSWNYKVDLKQGQNREQRDPKTLLRHLIPRKREYFDYIFNLLKEDYLIANYSYELISRLEVDPNLIEKVIKLEDYDENGNQVEFKFENIIDTSNSFQLLYLFRIIRWISEYKNVTKAHVDVIYNEDEDKVEGSNMVVTGTSCQTNSDIPAPTPAVPVNRGKSSDINKTVKFEKSRSDEGKSSNIVSASPNSGNNVPPPPPPPNSLPDVPIQVNFSNSEEKEFEVKVYPPGGKQVDSDGFEAPNVEDDSKAQVSDLQNYQDEMKLSEFYLFEKYEKEISDWVQRFIDKGGFIFL